MRRHLGDWEKARSARLGDAAHGHEQAWYPTDEACSLYLGNRLDAAAATAESVHEHQPHNLEALLILVAAQVELGQLRWARATAEAGAGTFHVGGCRAMARSTPLPGPRRHRTLETGPRSGGIGGLRSAAADSTNLSSYGSQRSPSTMRCRITASPSSDRATTTSTSRAVSISNPRPSGTK